jgi:hypothetical protein
MLMAVILTVISMERLIRGREREGRERERRERKGIGEIVFVTLSCCCLEKRRT